MEIALWILYIIFTNILTAINVKWYYEKKIDKKVLIFYYCVVICLFNTTILLLSTIFH